MAGVIEKINKRSAVDLVFEKMKDLIKNGTWSVADKIPAESELAEMFDVNRLTVRMALQKLNTLGLVQTRAGEGTFVTEFSFADYIGQVSEFYPPNMFEDIADFRTAVELECCRLAMDRATPEELEELKRRLDVYVDCRNTLWKRFRHDVYLTLVDYDLDFHEYICLMAKNSLLTAAFAMARDAIYQHLLMIVKKRSEQRSLKFGQGMLPEHQAELHQDIYQAIVDKNFPACEKAYLAMVDHNVNVFEL